MFLTIFTDLKIRLRGQLIAFWRRKQMKAAKTLFSSLGSNRGEKFSNFSYNVKFQITTLKFDKERDKFH